MVESTDDYEIVTRRRPRPDDTRRAETDGTGDAPEGPSRPSPEPEDATSWLLDQLPEPSAAPRDAAEDDEASVLPAFFEPADGGGGPGAPKARQATEPDNESGNEPKEEAWAETHEPSFQYGGEPSGESDTWSLHGSTQEPPVSRSSSTTSMKRGRPMRIAIAATEFNYDITSMMLERARSHAHFLGAEVTKIVRVPGVFDLPLAAKRLLQRDDVDAIAALGCVIEGETDHDDLVIQHAARKLVDLSLESGKPVGLGITGPGMSRLQAMARIDRAKDAVEAVVRLHREMATI